MDVKQGVLSSRSTCSLSTPTLRSDSYDGGRGGQLLVGLMASARGDRGTGSVMAFRTFTLSASTLCQCSCRWGLHEERGHARCDSRSSLSRRLRCATALVDGGWLMGSTWGARGTGRALSRFTRSLANAVQPLFGRQRMKAVAWVVGEAEAGRRSSGSTWGL